jgi:hypothetical protein
MTMTPTQIESYVTAAAAALELPLSPAHRPGVLRYFALAADFAALIEAVPLSMSAESAVHFAPVAPEEKEA